jgi:hypothetical protein
MKPNNKLMKILNAELKWNKRRIECFVEILLAIMVVRTINLPIIANQIVNRTKLKNRYRRLQRFFSGCNIDYDQVAKFIFKLFCFDNKKVYLLMDRTNWKWGKIHINILFLSIVYRGIGIPIYWLMLNKGGNSNTRERASLIQRFVKVFGKESIAGLLADREFIGKRWFGWLISEKIPFYIRIRNDADTTNKNGKGIEAAWLFYALKSGEQLTIGKKKIFDCDVFLSGGRAPNGDLMIIASNIECGNAVETYLLRWQIEVLFQCLKSRGFRFEDTHITNRNKIKKLIVLLVIGFCWAHIVGEWRHSNECAIKLKKHGRKAISYFRYGLDLIHEAIATLVETARPIKKLINFLVPPDIPLECFKKQRQVVGMVF